MSVLETYFIDPILQNGWFNPVNTLVYALLLVLGVYLVYKLLIKMQVKIDSKFFLALLPFIFFGSSMRVLHDAAHAGVLSPELFRIYGSPLFVTPGSYMITFFFALFSLLFSLAIQRFTKFPYWKTMFVIGFILSIYNVFLLPVATLIPLAIILGITGFWILLFYGISLVLKHPYFKNIKPRILTTENQGILGAHFLDASATFIALSLYGYVEQHVVPRLLFPFLGPVSMFLLKVIVVIPVLYLIDRYAEDRNFKNLLKIVVLILGLAPGLRDLIRLIVLV